MDFGGFCKKKEDKKTLKEQNFEKLLSKETPRGELLYHIPTKMQVGIISECIVRISVDKEIIKVGIEILEDTKTESIIISKIMKVTLSESKLEGHNFEIEEVSKERQQVRLEYVNNFTEWLFNVKPLNKGTHKITIKVYTIELIKGKEEEQQLTFRETINVQSYAVEKQEQVFKKFLNFVFASFDRNMPKPTTAPERIYELYHNPIEIWNNLSRNNRNHLRNCFAVRSINRDIDIDIDIDNVWWDFGDYLVIFHQKRFIEQLENKDASEKFDMVAIIIFIFYKKWVRWHREWRMGIGEWRNWLYHQKVPLQIKIDISVLFILYQLGTNISLNSFYEICSEKNIANYDSITESLSRLERFDLIRCNSGKINIPAFVRHRFY